MSQPPFPPWGGDQPEGERSGPQDPDPDVGADDPTRKFELPGDGVQRNATRQFGQPESGQPWSGQASYGQPAYPEYGRSTDPQDSAPQYPPLQYPQAQYLQAQYPPPQYAQARYGQPPYAQYGQPWGSPGEPGEPPPQKSGSTVIALVVGAVVLLAAIAAGLSFLLRAGDPDLQASPASGSSNASAPSEPALTDDRNIPSATVAPDGLGDNPDLDELAQECYDGDMDSCDRLYEVAELDSLYGLYGGTCAGRQDVSDADTVFCADAFPEN